MKYFKNVFVLCTGRCGSLTFAESCKHLSNYSVAHESLSNCSIDERFDYPNHHIEVDNRLSWFLGDLYQRFDRDDTFFVHLTRNEELIAKSYLRRWNFKNGIIPAFSHGIIIKKTKWRDDEKLNVCKAYIHTVNTNIKHFMKDVNGMIVELESPETFSNFLEAINAKGDLKASLDTFQRVHNESVKITTLSLPNHTINRTI